MRKLISKLLSPARFIIHLVKRLATPLNIILYLIVVAIFFSPSAAGFIVYLVNGSKVAFTVATAYIAFWAGPFTPAIPIQLAITFALARPWNALFRYIRYRRDVRWL